MIYIEEWITRTWILLTRYMTSKYDYILWRTHSLVKNSWCENMKFVCVVLLKCDKLFVPYYGTLSVLCLFSFFFFHQSQHFTDKRDQSRLKRRGRRERRGGRKDVWEDNHLSEREVCVQCVFLINETIMEIDEEGHMESTEDGREREIEYE